jgi:Flp pilus assembly protein TadD
LREAVRWHTVAIEAGFLVAAMNMENVVEKQGDLARAEELLTMAAAQDHEHKRFAAYNLALFLQKYGRADEAGPWMRVFREG